MAEHDELLDILEGQEHFLFNGVKAGFVDILDIFVIALGASYISQLS